MLRRLTLASWIALGVLLLAGGTVTLLRRASSPEPLPQVYAELPDFELVDQSGEPFGLEQLSGRVWVANFIFTSCAVVCPRLTSLMRDIQDEVAGQDDIRLVSFSVDPVRDTPQRLRDYAQAFEADHAIWSFLTGSFEAVEETVVQGFLMTMQRGEADDSGFFDIVHGERFVVVDREGRIRGYFDADEDGMELLLRTARRLLQEPPAHSPAVVSESG